MNFLLLLFWLNLIMPEVQDKIIYIGDPMCSWCYGFSPQLETLEESLDGSIEFEYVMGGLRPYNTETIKDLSDFLKGHWDEVHKYSGVEFDFQVLFEDWHYDTEPPCRAYVVVRDYFPDKASDFFKGVQKLFYLKGQNLNVSESYLPLLKSLDIDDKVFVKAFESEKFKTLVKSDFEHAQDLNVNAFPTLLYQRKGEIHVLAQGFTTSDRILERIKDIKGR